MLCVFVVEFCCIMLTTGVFISFFESLTVVKVVAPTLPLFVAVCLCFQPSARRPHLPPDTVRCTGT